MTSMPLSIHKSIYSKKSWIWCNKKENIEIELGHSYKKENEIEIDGNDLIKRIKPEWIRWRKRKNNIYNKFRLIFVFAVKSFYVYINKIFIYIII